MKIKPKLRNWFGTALVAASLVSAQGQSLWDLVVATEDLSTLKTAVEAAELESALQGVDPLTVFAPNNAAFAALPEGALEGLLADIPQLTAVLTYHVLAGTQLAADLAAGDYVTLNGASVTVTTPNGLVKVNDATVIGPDVLASNGVAHVIDTVLLPAGPPPPQSLWDLVVATEDLSTLKTAVEAAELESALQGVDPLTVFAPNNAAFAALPEGALEGLLADIPQLTAVLTYHVLAGTQLAADLAAGDYVTLNGASVTVTTPNGLVKVNDATVIGPDVLASNGVAHVIDTVLLPAGPPPPQSLWDLVVATEDLSTLKTAVEAAELESALQGVDPLTVFAPNNAAFAALPEGALEGLLADIPQLTAVLTYHVLAGTQLAADLVAGDYVTLNGASVTVTTPNGLVKVNDATVIGPDVLASNGVAHVIDTVLLPAGPPPPQSLWDHRGGHRGPEHPQDRGGSR
jgi:transforming growth factor-beta-induced protein